MRKLLIAVCFASAVSFGQEFFTTHVFVSNFNDQPIANADVKLYDSAGMAIIYAGTTNAEGRFEITMSPGRYRIKLFENGEIKKDKSINLPELPGRRMYNKVRIHVLYEPRERFTLDNLLFEFNSARINEGSYPLLNKLADYLLNDKDAKFEIAGHTDAVGSAQANLTLSQSRAEAVRDYLIARGVSSDQLLAKGYGEMEPVADNETEEGRTKNRRTEVRKLE